MKPLGDFEGASCSFTTIGEGRVLVVDPDAQSFGLIEGTRNQAQYCINGCIL